MFVKRLVIKNVRNYSTKLAYISDLHLEHVRWGNSYPKINKNQLNIINNDNIHGIAILGDLSNPYYDNFTNFLAYCGSLFKNVYFVAGNHEYYVRNLKVDLVKDTIENQILKSIENAKYVSNNSSLHYLNNSHIQLKNNKIIIGSTLWSDQTNSIHKNNNKYFNVYRFVTNEHNEAKKYLTNILGICKKFNNLHNLKEPNVTILSHYLPSYSLVVDKYKHIYYQDKPRSERYFSNLDYLLKHPVKNWICGHSHSNNNLYVNGVYLGINSYISQKNMK